MKVRREPDLEIHKAIRNRVSEFWISIREHKEPKPDFAKDSEFIQRLYSFAEPGKIFNADDNVSRLAFAYRQTAQIIKEAELRRRMPPKLKS